MRTQSSVSKSGAESWTANKATVVYLYIYAPPKLNHETMCVVAPLLAAHDSCYILLSSLISYKQKSAGVLLMHPSSAAGGSTFIHTYIYVDGHGPSRFGH